VVLVLRLVLALVVAAVPNTCGLDPMTGPGQVDYHATLTVLNRTEANVTVTNQQRSFTIPACSETTEQDFPINNDPRHYRIAEGFCSRDSQEPRSLTLLAGCDLFPGPCVEGVVDRQLEGELALVIELQEGESIGNRLQACRLGGDVAIF